MKIAVIFRGDLRSIDRTKEKFKLVIDSIHRAFENNDIDFYMHLWGDSNEKSIYESCTDFKKIIIEDNSKYNKKIGSINDTNILLTRQISCSLSLNLICEEFINKNIEYDYIFITRPDLPFTEKIEIPDISDNLIYINEHGNNIDAGDYCFLLTKNNINIFKDAFYYLEKGFLPNPHYWIYNYLNSFCKKDIKLLNVSVGKNCEIFKHLENFPYPGIIENLINFVK